MEENLVYKKKAKIFIAVAVVIRYVIVLLSNMINAQFTVDSVDQYYRTQWIYGAISLGTSVITLLMLLGMGKMLTKSNMKALAFTGSVYFGMTAVNVVSSIFSTICETLMRLGILYAETYSNITVIIQVVFLPLIAFAAYFAFSAFEGMNPRFPSQSLDTFKTSLSRVRISYFVYIVLSAVVTALFSSVPNFVFASLGREFAMSDTVTILLNVFSWLSIVCNFAVLYLVGYKATKSHVEAMGFAAVIKLADKFGSVFVSTLDTIVDFVVNALGLTNEENFGTVSIINSISSTVIYVLGTVISVVLVMYLLKVFFPRVKASVTAEPILNEEETLTEETSAEASDSITE